MQITPAILTDSFATAQEQINIALASGVVEKVQIDVIDGLFADNLTLTPADLTVAEFGNLGLDLHLIVDEPMDFVFETIAVASYLPIRTIFGQVEHMSHLVDFAEEVTRHHYQVGLALDLHTPLEAIDEEIWPMIHKVLIMNHQAGFQDLRFASQVKDKYIELADWRKKFPTLQIVSDGGIRTDHFDQLKKLGVDEAVVGGSLWESVDPVEALQELVKLAK